MDKWGYSYLIEQKTLFENEKLLLTSNFSFFHNVFKSCLLLMCQNEYLWSKGLRHGIIFVLLFTETVAENNPQLEKATQIEKVIQITLALLKDVALIEIA